MYISSFNCLLLLGFVVLAYSTFTPSSEISALQDLYRSTNGPQWTNKTNWMSGDPCNPYTGPWFGILCFSDLEGSYHVWFLSLFRNNLQGTLPSSLRALSQAGIFQVTSNSIAGTIPEELFELTQLSLLDLQMNGFTGTIPDQVGKLTLLTSLYMNNNQLTGTVPEGVGASKGLVGLALSRNAFTGRVPGSVWDLPNLTSLYINNNCFMDTQLPDDDYFHSMPQLNLFAGNACLTGHVPSGVCDIKYYSLQNNNFTCPLPACCTSLCGKCQQGKAI